MPWDIQFKKGVGLPQIGWWLDAQKPAERAFVSHAHSDHCARHKEIVCTAASSIIYPLARPNNSPATQP